MSTDTATAIHLDEDEFRKQVESGKGVAAIDFWAEWCQPCKILEPTVNRLAERFKDRALVAKVDIESAQAIALEHGISSIPTILIFKDGKVVDRAVGIASEDDLAKRIEAQL